MANTGFRMMPGWVSAGELNNTSSALITSFTVQSDQDTGRSWLRPGNEADLVLPYAQLVETPTGHRYRQGGVGFKFPLRILSPLMTKYIQDTLFAGDVQSANVTAQTYNRRTDAWEAYNVVARLPEFASEAELAAGGFDQHIISFVSGVAAPDGPDVSPSQAFSYLVAGINGTVTFTVTNNGSDTARANSDTFNDILLTYELPTEFDLVSVSGSGWTIEYSTDGVIYSSTPPSPISNTTHIRGTYSATVASGAAASDLVVTVNPNSSGDVVSVVTATTVGDADTSNDQDTDTASVVARGFDSGWDVGFGAPAFDSGFDNGWS